VSPLKTTPCI